MSAEANKIYAAFLECDPAPGNAQPIVDRDVFTKQAHTLHIYNNDELSNLYIGADMNMFNDAKFHIIRPNASLSIQITDPSSVFIGGDSPFHSYSIVITYRG